MLLLHAKIVRKHSLDQPHRRPREGDLHQHDEHRVECGVGRVGGCEDGGQVEIQVVDAGKLLENLRTGKHLMVATTLADCEKLGLAK